MIADKLLKKIQESQPKVFVGIKFFDLFMIVPYFKSLGKTYSLLVLFFVLSHWDNGVIIFLLQENRQ